MSTVKAVALPMAGLSTGVRRIPGRRSDGRRTRHVRTGLIYNPRATANIGRAPLRALNVPCLVPQTREELTEALAEFARQEVGIVAVSGGDGTVRDVLTALPQAYGDAPLPAVAIIASGRTDLIAGDVGAQGREDELARILAGAKNGTLREVHRPVMRANRLIDSDGAIRRDVRGMLFGAATFVYATELAQGEVFATGASHARAVAMTFATVLKRVLLQGDPDGLRSGQPMRLRADGNPDLLGADARRALFLATTLRSGFVLGRDPFYAPAQPDELRYLDVAAPARGVARAIGALAIGKPWLAGRGWNAGAARVLDLELESKVVIDGEVFEPLPGYPLRVVADAPMTFVTP